MINEVHRMREKAVKKRWSKVLAIPIEQFKRTVFIQSKTKKQYENNDSFLGTLVVGVRRSSWLQYRVDGLLEAAFCDLNLSEE